MTEHYHYRESIDPEKHVASLVHNVCGVAGVMDSRTVSEHVLCAVEDALDDDLPWMVYYPKLKTALFMHWNDGKPE